ncbi:MotA/TolQ/ExbB proton channel family protein [Halomonas saccharevitans]|uniref:MotA/TolQ/ExbB proton channel family protein n=1 Tax=Halomonas saccharevitans TaxID=416872 RepID=A0ABU3NEZ5_9GAMM|nr:MotA/TolQ/ExbB proton channel family protein [Halomonas saccharevitans]MDT8878741.1 MotA/TolQ/ExbB proton channel family protein [Halomonas saccharevitans]
MDFATIIGMLGATALIAGAIGLGDSPMIFINPISLLIVFGGSLMVVLSQLRFSECRMALTAASRAFRNTLPDTSQTIEEMLEVAHLARKGGLLALEDFETRSRYLQQGLQMLADGFDQKVIKEMLDKERLMTLDRNQTGAKAFRLLTDVAPAMGMVGTLIGLIQMLSNMDDPSSIGPAMAVALLTTLYGVLLANIVAKPIAEKLETRMDHQEKLQSLWTDALMAIQDGKNPRIVEQMLLTYLPDDVRDRRKQGGEGDAATSGDSAAQQGTSNG